VFEGVSVGVFVGVLVEVGVSLGVAVEVAVGVDGMPGSPKVTSPAASLATYKCSSPSANPPVK